MHVAVALGVLVGGWCLGIHGRQDTVGGVVVKSCLGQSVIWFLDLNGERKKFMDEMPVECRTIDRYGLRWACTYGTSHPGPWSAHYRSLYLRNTFGYTDG